MPLSIPAASRLPRGSRSPAVSRLFLLGLVLGLVTSAAASAQWTHWRGPDQTGVAADGAVIDSWSKDGTHLAWRADFTGRSTAAVVDGRVCASGRTGEDIHRLETVACWDAFTGSPLWQRSFPVYLTSVPWNRVSWGDLAADPETGHVYAQLVAGRLIALAPDGETTWEWRLGEDLGRFSGYGGRTNTPIVDGDRVIAHVISAGFGETRGPADRWMAFDKRTGDILWIARGVGPLKDLNTYSTPVVAEIGGRRQVVTGGADGWLYGIDVRSGDVIWSYHLSQRGLNASPVVHDGRVYASHSEENLDAALMGRVVALDVRKARGDVTADDSVEMWRIDELQAGYATPLLHEGVLYVVDNSANLYALDAMTGEEHWELNFGTVGKGSPVWADGKIFITEVNGNVVVIDPETPKVIAEEHLEVEGGRYAEIYSSPAIAYGRIYFSTEEGMYALAGDDAPSREQALAAEAETRDAWIADADARETLADGPATTLRVVPAVVVATADATPHFTVHAFGADGRRVKTPDSLTWTLEGVPGTLKADGDMQHVHFDGAKIAGTAHGQVVVQAGGSGESSSAQTSSSQTSSAQTGALQAKADLRIAGPLPWRFDFESMPVDKAPAGWLGTGKGAKVVDLEGESAGKGLAQPKAPRGAPRATMLLGPSSMTGYTVQADVLGHNEGRRYTDLGVVNNGYTFDLQGAHQRVQLISWAAERRMMQQSDYAWEMGVWHTIKLRVDFEGTGDARKAIVRGKVWKRGEAEPAAWTITAEDPHPIDTGSPGIYTFAPVEARFDNVVVEAAGPLADASSTSSGNPSTTASTAGTP